MENEQNWYRQLAALVLLSSARAAVEYLTNPSSRENATRQLKESFASIDYDALANALTKTIDQAAVTSKDRLSDTIDTLRERGLDAVEEAKEKAEHKLGHKRRGGKMKFFFALLVGGLVAYFIMDEQRRDELMDRLTGASGPIQTSYQSPGNSASSPAQNAAQQADQVTEAVKKTAEKAEKTAEKSSSSDKAQA